MQTIRQIYQDTPSLIQLEIPEALQHHTVEVTIRLVEDLPQQATDANGWPIGFFEATAGCLADDPIERAPQGEYEQRLELE
jgi:hypothetical protein